MTLRNCDQFERLVSLIELGDPAEVRCRWDSGTLHGPHRNDRPSPRIYVCADLATCFRASVRLAAAGASSSPSGRPQATSFSSFRRASDASGALPITRSRRSRPSWASPVTPGRSSVGLIRESRARVPIARRVVILDQLPVVPRPPFDRLGWRRHRFEHLPLRLRQIARPPRPSPTREPDLERAPAESFSSATFWPWSATSWMCRAIACSSAAEGSRTNYLGRRLDLVRHVHSVASRTRPILPRSSHPRRAQGPI